MYFLIELLNANKHVIFTFFSTKKKTQARVQIHESHTTKIRKQKERFFI